MDLREVTCPESWSNRSKVLRIFPGKISAGPTRTTQQWKPSKNGDLTIEKYRKMVILVVFIADIADL